MLVAAQGVHVFAGCEVEDVAMVTLERPGLSKDAGLGAEPVRATVRCVTQATASASGQRSL